MQRRLWTTGLSGVSVDGIARSAGLNRPSLAAAFGDKDAIYAQAAARLPGSWTNGLAERWITRISRQHSEARSTPRSTSTPPRARRLFRDLHGPGRGAHQSSL